MPRVWHPCGRCGGSLDPPPHAAPVPAAACRLPIVPGPCKVLVTRWAFDAAQGKCITFSYGGCKGNGNKFYSEKECKEYCGAPQLSGIPLGPPTPGQQPAPPPVLHWICLGEGLGCPGLGWICPDSGWVKEESLMGLGWVCHRFSISLMLEWVWVVLCLRWIILGQDGCVLGLGWVCHGSMTGVGCFCAVPRRDLSWVGNRAIYPQTV